MIPSKLDANQSIGVFDSGLGGLTVLKSLEKILPGESFLYFGDTAHVPYGTRSNKTVIRYSIDIVRFLAEEKVKLIVIACNTASSIALNVLRESYQIPILGVVEPVIRKSIETTKSGTVGIIGTRATIQSKAYFQKFKSMSPGIRVIDQACPLFVPLIEEGWENSAVAESIAKEYLNNMIKTKMDTLVLGCTHYPILNQTLTRVLPENVRMISSGEPVALEVRQYLARRNMLATAGRRVEKIYVTDYPQQFNQLGSRFLGRPLGSVEQVELC